MHNVNQIVKALVSGNVQCARDLAIAADRAWSYGINLFAADLTPHVVKIGSLTIEELIIHRIMDEFEFDDQVMDHCESIASEKQALHIFTEIYNFKQWAQENVKSKSVQCYIFWTMHVFGKFIRNNAKDLDKLHNIDLQNDAVSSAHYVTAMMYASGVRDEIGPIIRKNI